MDYLERAVLVSSRNKKANLKTGLTVLNQLQIKNPSLHAESQCSAFVNGWKCWRGWTEHINYGYSMV